ncbi:MAG TPA: hypothetical protein VFZ21_12390 [Gemmatimonadaceae bacterium]|nr:hypothetical protein [Gemmatimonadaceae bacterium]
MSTLGRSLAVTGLLLLSVPPSARPAASHDAPVVSFTPVSHFAENIRVVDFASSLTYSLTQRPPVRRGVTSSISIKKNFIDLVPFGQVSVSGAGASISNLDNGTDGGTGYISMRLTVPSNATLGAVITLSVGLIDRFTFRVVNRGVVASVTKNPDPATLQPGTEWTATVTGTDLGGPGLLTIPCHTVTVPSRSNTSVQYRLRRSATCSTTTFSFRLVPSATNDPPTWTTSSGGGTGFAFSYVPPPPTGVTCTSIPNITAPVVTRPLDNQVIVFGSGTASPTRVTVAWEQRTQPGNFLPPNNEWLVTRHTTTQLGTTTSTKPVTVTSLSTVLSVAIPEAVTVSVRAKNCGTPGPATTITFSTRY